MKGIHGGRLKTRNSDDIFLFNKRAGIRGRRVKVRNPVGMIIINEMKGIRGRQVNKSEKPCGYDYNQRNERDSWETG